MAGRNHIVIQVEGLTKFRRELRKADKVVGQELQRDLRDAAKIVAAAASAGAPKRTGKLAGSYRGSARGVVGIVRSRLVYARFIEYGFHPRGGTTFVEGRNVVGRAMERETDHVVDALGDAVDRAARRMGWH